MKFNPVRWAGRDVDRYFGPFTFTPQHGPKRWGIVLGSGSSEDGNPGCRLRLELYWLTVHVRLPAIIKPYARWVPITSESIRAQMIADGRAPGYFDVHEREYGIFTFEGSVHLHYGPQTLDSETSKGKVWFYPWLERVAVRHSYYGLEGELFADMPGARLRRKWADRWKVEWLVRDACPVARFDFHDFDGQQITATCRIDETEYRRGKGLFRLFFLGRNKVYRSLDLSFSSEVGQRKGSWKGGTIGHSIAMLPGELHEAAFRRYCAAEGLTFIGATPAPQPELAA